jgi:DMSO reductase family type II enzyme molybdopterin subunit
MIAGATRRDFLKATGSALSLTLLQLSWRDAAARSRPAAPAFGSLEYRGFEDLYRRSWTWDRVAKSTHEVNCWYQRCCSWDVFVKEGIVWREEQSATYPQTNPDVPDFNPRGCQKGACFSERMYDPSRLRHPLKRVGARGQGTWRRISWEEALREIADKCIDVLTTDGPGSIIWDEGSGGSNIGVQRTHTILDTPVLDLDSEFGDHHPGAAVTCGKISFSSSADDLFYSDLILIWGGNPSYTQIPNAHFINEARYKGAQVVVIAPDYNASAIHADQWIPVNVASDAAFGLSLAHVIVEEDRCDAHFLAEQTDLPLLVRTDTGRFLRDSDLRLGGEEDTFYVYDPSAGAIREASKTSLSLQGFQPALAGEFTARTTAGPVKVVPAFALLRKQLLRYPPEVTEEITGVSPRVVREFARHIAGAKAATVVTQSSFGKFYHGLEMERAQFLVFALTGQFGRKGSGINGFPLMWLSGHEGLIVGSGSLPPRLGYFAVGLKKAPDIVAMRWKGYTEEMILYELTRQMHAEGGQPSSTLLLHFHGGLDQLFASAVQRDPYLKRGFESYLDEAVRRGWQTAPTARPRIFIEVGGNYLRRNRAYPKIIETLWAALDLAVTVDWRMSFTALHSDYVLPAATYYETDSLPWTTPIAPFAHATTRVVKPIAESKSDWEFHCLLLRTLQERAVGRGMRSFTDRAGKKRRLDEVYDQFTFGGRYTESDPERLMEAAVSLASNLDGIDWKSLKEKGFQRYSGVGSGYMNIGNATDFKAGETITANTWHTDQKRPWPTLTRRMQFYIDHDLYRELGEELPVHKDLPAIGGEYPLQMTSGHTRWSIHAAWRDVANLLRLQRGRPTVRLAAEDAQARGIRDGDEVRVHNELGSIELQARVSPAVRPGQIIVHHAWEPYQFRRHRSQQALTPNPINPIQLAGGYFHLQPRLAVGSPGASDRGTRVDVERLSHEPG